MLIILLTRWTTFFFASRKGPKKSKKRGGAKIILRKIISYVKMLIPYVALTEAIIQIVKILLSK
jgi:hypothetical protein